MDHDESNICCSGDRLTQLACPACEATRWILASDNVGPAIGGTPLPYERREYSCSACGRTASGWSIRQQSPEAFLQQPHPLHPMATDEFEHWVGVLRANFSDHPKLSEVGRAFVPATPDEVRARREAYLRTHPVLEMKDQDGARRRFPDLRRTADWLDVMRPGDHVILSARGGDVLVFESAANGALAVKRVDTSGRVRAQKVPIGSVAARVIAWRYLSGDVEACDREIVAAEEAGEPASYPEYWRERDAQGWPGDHLERLIALQGEPTAGTPGRGGRGTPSK